MSLRVTKTSTGIRICTYKMPHVQSVALSIIVKVGGKYEDLSECGLSHFLEHMAFQSTSNRTARQIAEEFDSIGGQFNAYTSKEHTVYYAKTLSEHFDTSVEILSDILQNSLFLEKEISKEYQVICQEIAQAFDNPDDIAYEKLYEIAFKNQPLGRSILGTAESISKFDTNALKQYVQKHYHAENIVISVAGNIDHDKALDKIQSSFVFTPNQSQAIKKSEYIGGNILVNKSFEQSTVVMGFKSSSYLDLRTFYHTQMLALILGGGISSRVFQRIREDLGLAYSTGAFNSSYDDIGVFSIYASAAHENVEKVISEFINEISKICDNISEDELIRAKAQIKANILIAEEKVSYKSEEIGRGISIFGEYYDPHTIIESINKTTVDDILKVARSIFTSALSLSVVSPSANVEYGEVCALLKERMSRYEV